MTEPDCNMENRMKTLYLGGCKGTWRSLFIKELPEWFHYDPFSISKQECLADFVHDDIHQGIDASDAVVIYINYERYTGSCVEAGYAYAKGKPVILIWKLRGRIDSMLIGVSKYVFNHLQTAIDFIRERGVDL
ncbi:MAG: hypothetical protein ACYTFW_00970 [Planctomycetota bacterium]|jgi:nucleoside 2-deoxyribosyltransferase